jgi:predicted secreted hydrolase
MTKQLQMSKQGQGGHATLLGVLWLLIGSVAIVPAGRSDDWTVPRAGHLLSFPRDHGSHPDFKIEWWYLTGHLEAGERRFGFQATFFRLGQKPVDVPTGEDFGTEQLYLAHMGLSDPETGRFLHEERLNRGGWDAGAKVGDLEVFNGNWSLHRDGEGMQLHGSIRAEASLELRLEPEKPHVVFGEDSISRKGPEGTAASYYITWPRLAAKGTLKLGEELLEVTGSAWMDHEISSSQLDENQIGWDWTCIQFTDGREIMGYVLRTKDGGISPYSKLVWIDQEGTLIHVKASDYEWKHEGGWKSPATGAIYPISPLIVTRDPASGAERRLRLLPLLENQEMTGGTGGVSYWEGACEVKDETSGEVVGRAYLEMTGYADDIGQKLR